MIQRGVKAYKEQAAEAGERRVSGFANILLMKPGESITGRFRGLFRVPAHQLTEAEAVGLFGNEWQVYFTTSLGLRATFDTAADFAKAVMRRYKQIEPVIYLQHYIHGNKGRDQFCTCSDQWEPRSSCAICWAKDNGDSRVSLRTQNVFTFHPRRWYHKLESAQKGAKAQYLDCPAAIGEQCVYCAQGHEAKQEGVKYLSLADMHAEGVIACEERVSKRCGVCGIGQIRNVGWACSNPSCGEPVSNYRILNPAPENYDPRVICPVCKQNMMPEEMLVCNKGCEMPRRCQLHDVDVLVQRMGKGKSTTYQFTEQWPAEPLSEDMLGMNLPGYEHALKPPALAEQIRLVGLASNPFTGEAVSDTQSYDTPETVASPFGEGEGQEPGETGLRAADDQDIPW